MLTWDECIQIIKLRLKISCDDQDAIDEANQIAQKAGYSNYAETNREINSQLSEHTKSLIEGWSGFEKMGLSPGFLTTWFAVTQAFIDYPNLADMLCIWRIQQDSFLFYALFEDQIFPNDNINYDKRPLPKKPDKNASYQELLKWIEEMKELGFKMPMEKISKEFYRSPGRMRQLHSRYVEEHGIHPVRSKISEKT